MAMTAERAIASAIRPGLRQSAQPSSPHTPSRTYSSTYSSPGAGFRQEEDVVIIELGSRYIRAGFEGEAAPQCSVTLGPETSRRIGDYRDWQPGAATKKYKIKSLEALPRDLEWDKILDKWSIEHELWRMDLRKVDLGLFEDKLERAVREIYIKYLLTDAGTQKLVLVLPSIVPHPLLSSLLEVLFSRWKFSTIGLLPSTTMATIAAGLRSALIIDIGWEETIMTSVCEYRETASLRSTRSMKKVVKAMAKVLYDAPGASGKIVDDIDFDFAEEMVVRLGWCKSFEDEQVSGAAPTSQSRNLSIDAQKDAEPVASEDEAIVEIEIPGRSSGMPLKLPLATCAKPVDSALFAVDLPNSGLDESELPLHRLLFKLLSSLPPDVRGTCMSRIIFTGDGAQIAGIGRRTLDEVSHLVSKYGWSSVRGEVVDRQREKLKEINGNKQSPVTAAPKEDEATSHPIDGALHRAQTKDTKPPVQGILRQIDSLGPWVGASLMSGIKVKGMVEVDCERFLQQGLAGAQRDGEISVVSQRQSLGPGMPKPGDRSSWTLAGWG